MIRVLILLIFVLGILPSYAQQTPDSSKAIVAPPVEEVYYSVQQLPQFKGSFIQYLTSNINYPKSALKAKVQGTLVIKFVVDAKGNVEQVQVDEKSTTKHKELIEEAKKAILKSSGDWVPAKHKGKNVKIHMRQSIQFYLGE
jgi:TonB family protein